MSSPSPISCLNCGYSLEGLNAAALCPECAKPVSDSLAFQTDTFRAIPNPRLTSRWLLLLASAQAAGTLLLLIPLFDASLSAAWLIPTGVIFLMIRLCWIGLTKTFAKGKLRSVGSTLRLLAYLRMMSAALLLVPISIISSGGGHYLLLLVLVFGLPFLVISVTGAFFEWHWMVEFADLLQLLRTRFSLVLLAFGIGFPVVALFLLVFSGNAKLALPVFALSLASGAIASFCIAQTINARTSIAR